MYRRLIFYIIFLAKDIIETLSQIKSKYTIQCQCFFREIKLPRDIPTMVIFIFRICAYQIKAIPERCNKLDIYVFIILARETVSCIKIYQSPLQLTIYYINKFVFFLRLQIQLVSLTRPKCDNTFASLGFVVRCHYLFHILILSCKTGQQPNTKLDRDALKKQNINI